MLSVVKKTPFDPDELVLTKSEIVDFCDRVLKKWNESPAINTNNILAMTAVKASVVWTDDDSLKAIWNEILKWIFELLYENAMVKDDESWGNVMRKLKNKT